MASLMSRLLTMSPSSSADVLLRLLLRLPGLLASACLASSAPLAARLGLRAPHEHGAGPIDRRDVDHALGETVIVEADRRGRVVGGDEHTVEAALSALDVGETHVDRLADLALEVGRQCADVRSTPGLVTSSVYRPGIGSWWSISREIKRVASAS